MPQVHIELFFPLSRAVRKNAIGRVSLIQDILPDESLRSLLTRLARKYQGLRSVFDIEKQELNLMVWVTVNDTILTSPEFLDTKLKDGDSVDLLPVVAGG